MRELTYYVAVSLDGCIADADGSADAFPTTGDHMTAITGEYADALPTHVLDALGIEPPRTMFDAIVQGRASYDVARAVGITTPYRHLTQVVATRGPQEPASGVTFTADASAAVRDLKRSEGLGILLCGGGKLAGSLLPEIDRLVLKRYPIALGGGVPVFGTAMTGSAGFALRSVRSFESGVVFEEYVRG